MNVRQMTSFAQKILFGSNHDTKRVKTMLLALQHLTWLVYFPPITLMHISQWHIDSSNNAKYLKFCCRKFEPTRNGELRRLALRYGDLEIPPKIWSLPGPVIRTPVSANPGINFNPGFFIFVSKALSRIIFSFLFRVSYYQIVGKEN